MFFEGKTFVLFLISPDPSILLSCFSTFHSTFTSSPKIRFSPSKSFLHSSIHSPCWLLLLFLLSKSFQSFFFMPLRGIKNGLGCELLFLFQARRMQCGKNHFNLIDSQSVNLVFFPLLPLKNVFSLSSKLCNRSTKLETFKMT